jgi:hypothetical protein
MNAKKLLSVSEFLHGVAASMLAAVALESGECSCCGGCFDEDCECDYCAGRDDCRGIEIPGCLLKQAGISKDQKWKADAEDGAVTVRAVPEDEIQDSDAFPCGLPSVARDVFMEAGVCIPRLREILCGNDPIPF